MNEDGSGTVKNIGLNTAAPAIPERQNPYGQAYDLAFDVLLAKGPSAQKLEELGVKRTGDVIAVPVPNGVLLVDLSKREVTVKEAGPAKVSWSLLALHYLCAEETGVDTLEVSLNHFADCRTYCTVFSKRVVQRFLATAGRNEESFSEASERIGGMRVEGGGMRYTYNLLPRVPLDIVRYDGDEEFGPDANVIYRADAANLLPAEDRIVAAELLLEALSGRPLEEAARHT